MLSLQVIATHFQMPPNFSAMLKAYITLNLDLVIFLVNRRVLFAPAAILFTSALRVSLITLQKSCHGCDYKYCTSLQSLWFIMTSESVKSPLRTWNFCGKMILLNLTWYQTGMIFIRPLCDLILNWTDLIIIYQITYWRTANRTTASHSGENCPWTSQRLKQIKN